MFGGYDQHSGNKSNMIIWIIILIYACCLSMIIASIGYYNIYKPSQDKKVSNSNS